MASLIVIASRVYLNDYGNHNHNCATTILIIVIKLLCFIFGGGVHSSS